MSLINVDRGSTIDPNPTHNPTPPSTLLSGKKCLERGENQQKVRLITLSVRLSLRSKKSPPLTLVLYTYWTDSRDLTTPTLDLSLESTGLKTASGLTENVVSVNKVHTCRTKKYNYSSGNRVPRKGTRRRRGRYDPGLFHQSGRMSVRSTSTVRDRCDDPRRLLHFLRVQKDRNDLLWVIVVVVKFFERLKIILHEWKRLNQLTVGRMSRQLTRDISSRCTWNVVERGVTTVHCLSTTRMFSRSTGLNLFKTRPFHETISYPTPCPRKLWGYLHSQGTK